MNDSPSVQDPSKPGPGNYLNIELTEEDVPDSTSAKLDVDLEIAEIKAEQARLSALIGSRNAAITAVNDERIAGYRKRTIRHAAGMATLLLVLGVLGQVLLPAGLGLGSWLVLAVGILLIAWTGLTSFRALRKASA